MELLNRRKWMYNDRDVLNMLFRDNAHIFDIKWNYTGGGKPWNKNVPLGERYHKYANKLKEVLS